MTETIDFFKYQALLAELERIKGAKKPIHDFIKKLYKLANSFSYYNTEYVHQPQTLRYAFMLATRAMKYDGSTNSIKVSVRNSIDTVPYNLFRNFWVTPENVLETFEYYTSIIEIRPASVIELLKVEPMIELLELPRISISYYSINELSQVMGSKQIVKLILLKNNPDSKLGISITSDDKQLAKDLLTLQDLVSTINPILKEQQHEHNSSISPTV